MPEQIPLDLSLEAGRVFTPTAPIDERSLFAGRKEQIRLIMDAINQKGLHAIVYGERGVGKTSLSNVLHSFFGSGENIMCPRVNCDSMDTFESIWKKILDEIELTHEVKHIGLSDGIRERAFPSSLLLGEEDARPDSIRRVLTKLAQYAVPILIVDEFDRLGAPARRAFADTIKTLSDHSVSATVVLVGVADSVTQLIDEHQSVERPLAQIPMPRMSEDEIKEIIKTGLARLNMQIESDALARIALLAQGLPHYAHLLGLHSSRLAIDESCRAISLDIVNRAIKNALSGVNESIRSAWHNAVLSPRKDNLFSDVLLACALAETDDRGYFAAQDVRHALRNITKKPYEIYSFAQHMSEFCDAKRGPILQRTGTKRRFRYRFLNPLMQPFVIMQGISDKKVAEAELTSISRD